MPDSFDSPYDRPDAPPGSHSSRFASEKLQLGVICAATFVVWAGFGAILPYLPVFLKEEAHASIRYIGVIATAYYVGTFAFSALLGGLSDRIGRKPVIIAGIWLYGLSTLLFVTTTHPVWFILFRFLEGAGAAAVYPAGQAFIADITPAHRRSQAYGWMNTAQFGGLVAGPALAWPLYQLGGGHGLWSFYSIFLVGATFALATGMALLLLLREPPRSFSIAEPAVAKPPYRRLLTRPVVGFMVIASAMHLAMGSWEVVWSLWLRELGASMSFVGLTWMLFSLPMMFSFVGGYFADRHSRFLLMFSGYAISVAIWLVYGSTRNLSVFLVFSVLEGVAMAWANPAKQAFLVQVSPARWVGSVQGLEITAAHLAAMVGTLAAPFLFEIMAGRVIALGGAVALLALVAVAPILGPEWKRLSAAETHVVEAEPSGGG
ncbi:MAG: MFS transporter [Thermoleophilia bacterium]